MQLCSDSFFSSDFWLLKESGDTPGQPTHTILMFLFLRSSSSRGHIAKFLPSCGPFSSTTQPPSGSCTTVTGSL